VVLAVFPSRALAQQGEDILPIAQQANDVQVRLGLDGRQGSQRSIESAFAKGAAAGLQAAASDFDQVFLGARTQAGRLQRRRPKARFFSAAARSSVNARPGPDCRPSSMSSRSRFFACSS